jgi:hypothetical protein
MKNKEKDEEKGKNGGVGLQKEAIRCYDTA